MVVGQAHPLLVGDAPGDLDDGRGASELGLDHPQHHLAVVDENAVAGRERTQDFRMRQLHPSRVAGRGVAVEHEDVALVQLRPAVGEQAEPQLRSLQVDQHSDRPARLLLERADPRHPLPHRVVRGVAHVDAKNVGAGGEEGRDGLAIGRGRAEGGDDFYAAAATGMQGLLHEVGR